jgi:hypothetical protein
MLEKNKTTLTIGGKNKLKGLYLDAGGCRRLRKPNK